MSSGHTFMQAGQGLTKTGIAGSGGRALKALGLGRQRRDGSSKMAALLVTIAVAGMGAASSIGLSSPARTATVAFAKSHSRWIVHSAIYLRSLCTLQAAAMFWRISRMLMGEAGPELFMPEFIWSHYAKRMIGAGAPTTISTSMPEGQHDPAAVNAAVMRAAPHIVAAAVQTQHSQHETMSHRVDSLADERRNR